MYDRKEKLRELFKIESYETIIEDPRKTKAILMDLGMPNKDISLIIGVISTNQIKLRTQLFETKDPNVEELTAEISRDSYFSTESIKELLVDMILAMPANNIEPTSQIVQERKSITDEKTELKHFSIQIYTDNSEVPNKHMNQYIQATKGDSISQLFVAQSYDFGINDFPKNPKCAFRWYLKSATSTLNPDLCFMIGQCYQTGYGTNKSSKDAILWYQKAADLGNSSAMTYLGCMYRDGDGIIPDKTKSIHWLKKAFDNNDSRSAFELGQAYYKFATSEDDLKSAYSYYDTVQDKDPLNSSKANKEIEKLKSLVFVPSNARYFTIKENTVKVGMMKAFYSEDIPDNYKKKFDEAKNGKAVSQNDIAYNYLWGNDQFPTRHETALNWFELSASQNNAYAMYMIGEMHRRGRYFNKSATEALYWFEKSSKIGHPLTDYRLGTMYYYGDEIEQDYNKAKYYFEEVIEVKNGYQSTISDAMNFLGVMYEHGRGVFQSYEQAKEWYQKSSKLGNTNATCNLGLLYEYGHGMSRKNVKKAVQLYRESADKGNSRAQYYMGIAYENGEGGLPLSYDEAMKWYKLAMNNGNINAFNHIGDCYRYGRCGLERSIDKAKEHYQKAINLGSEKAKEKLNAIEKDSTGFYKRLYGYQ